ncbi:TIGR03086 family metal-binding protein [Streptomyces sp. B1866]|uniref:TIGR03086 family metal-binding protein n=1 Tax=Streptomyces sp. B1866 TaxID=3075431 RepID=UPI002891AF31|nr:TIGR03086 family metal-binding protein [Streptomyces sp. B1866]MDT3397075.1 TIGR03086 family metal-binding protein [Streptomyces sp. B1866]
MSETATPADADPRQGFLKAVALAGETIAAVRPDQYDAASPCPDFTARLLARHLISVLRRVAVAGSGGHPFGVGDFADDVPDGDWPKAWENAVRDAEAVWSDPAILGRSIELGFVTLPGAAAIVVYTTEISIHTWDLAKATGQEPAWDEAVLAAPVAAMRFAAPATPRGGPVPFGPVVEVAPDAPTIDQLVAWYGRQP